ncbi:transposable element Tcb1 transposase [Trichonephila clavipes]|nr:transposable element Tcb1 transposase [Trichonephila clavipes]
MKKNTEYTNNTDSSSGEFVAIYDNNVYTSPIIADKDILKFVPISRNIDDADSDDENEMNNAAPNPTSSEMREHHEKNEKVSNHGSIPITIDCNVVAFIVFEGFHQPIKRTKQKIGSHVGRNKITVMRICDRWMQEGTTDRRGRLHPPQCTTSREDRKIVRMAVTDSSVTSRTVAQHIESVTHHSVSARAIYSRVVCPQDVHCLIYP